MLQSKVYEVKRRKSKDSSIPEIGELKIQKINLIE
jgi:hypothetical protein